MKVPGEQTGTNWMLRSVLRDLLIPWVISAACIAVFLAIVFVFGLIAWPICFGIFLMLCVQRRTHDQA